ncbi:stage II sporulation protein E [Pullulanibacillus sp. KACC 23026]|uniref:stage II sporulation protein E n=1 Tax=Pullulanibacillus sp. KACC 23026 TaxID=3028315 RepID=UPI0023B05F6F|nr:stage II sporulation protein E [Pullulanibacillus sp. KACC 23026]WEG12717.1 stage II sporulation protein E [Pullulanibacillus sp. KACC 23026]
MQNVHVHSVNRPVEASKTQGSGLGSKWANKKLKATIISSLFNWEMACLFIGFLLGRAVILADMSPFGLAFFATALFVKPKRKLLALLSLVAGGLTQSILQASYLVVSIGLFVVLRAIAIRFIKQEEGKWLPYLVFGGGLITRLGFDFIQQGTLTLSDDMMSAVEAGLGFLLTLIFLQSLPLFTPGIRKRTLRNEEIVCLIILLASVLTGSMGWEVKTLSVEHILSRYFVLVFAYAGGAAIGSTVGVVIGLIVSLANVTSLYEMSLLAFSGLLGGLLKEGRKIGVSLGLIIGTLLIGLYGNGYQHLLGTTAESLGAIVLFFLTPHKIFKKLEAYVPGTKQYNQEQQQYLKKLRDVTASRVEQFSSLFQALSTSFSSDPVQTEEDDLIHEQDVFLSRVTERTCQTCFKKDYCWAKHFDETYGLMTEIMSETNDRPSITSTRLNRDFRRHCIKPDQVVNTIYEEQQHFYEELKLKKKVRESRRLVADQLLGVSEVMGNFAKEIQRERETHHYHEEQILSRLQEIGLDIDNLEIYNLEEGAVDIDMSIPGDYHGECEKIIAPILSDILNENIVVKNYIEPVIPNGYGQVTFGSAKAYVIESGVAHTAKNGDWISGDNYSMFELGAGKYAIAISDGMGNGERAHRESMETLKLLSKVLKSGIDETIAIKSINSILSLRTTDEIFSTLDLALVDLKDANCKFLKIGSNPSFVKRGDQVMMIEAGNLPMGIIQDVDVDVVGYQLKAGDLLIMMSDGIFESPKSVENQEVWLKRKIREMKTSHPQDIADLILEEVIRTSNGEIRDDMTVVVSKIEHHIPKWAAIPAAYSGKKQNIRKAQ